ncbi:cupin domain-containing protein [Hoyosella sp. YIM 151337]|uniref:cupin domain-containing protein n=1 Tax=Hoyosella sp. YIM 151337 TaxID=2992742 RepID=UPI00223699F4|nr:cupin domain-containing protein [Hoyosella sp. YIM 151337]MCW4354246.1 cupin domain-containing protein [Hoyosella sp. YIM 151337]
MRRSLTMLAAAALIAGCGTTIEPASNEAHQYFTPDTIDYQPGPGSLPEGSEFAVLEGDPAAEGFFLLRLKLPDGYQIPPHHHGGVERVTVIAGTLSFGHGEEADWETTTSLPTGSYLTIPPGHAHYVEAEGETVLQLSTIGPWTLTYVDPDDDPRE